MSGRKQGIGSCDRAGGCVYLISSGQSARDNFLYAHSRAGTTSSSARKTSSPMPTPAEPVSIYDAKVGGGFPWSNPVSGCVADGCRPTVTPTPSCTRHRCPRHLGECRYPPQEIAHCPKGKHKVKQAGKVRCVKKNKKQKGKGGKAKNRSGANRGAGK